MANAGPGSNAQARTRRSARESQLGWDPAEEPAQSERARAAQPERAQRERYPMLFQVARGQRRDRLSVALRLPLLIPLAIAWVVMQGLARSLMFAGWIAVFATKSYPAWLYTALAETFGYTARVEAYASLLTDRFPAFSGTNSPTTVLWADPPEGKLSRWRVGLWKLVILIPHFICIALLLLLQALITVVAWFAIIVSGRFPETLFTLSVGIHRWRYRVLGYLASFNDRFPPFGLAPRTPPATAQTVLTSGVLGFLILGAVGGLAGAANTLDSPRAQDVDYAALRQSEDDTAQWTFASGDRENPSFLLALVNADDPDEALASALQLGAESRAVTFVLQYYNGTPSDREVALDSATLIVVDRFGDATAVLPAVVTVGGTAGPTLIQPAGQQFVRFTFVIPSRSNVTELRIDPPWRSRDVAFRFR